MGLTPEQIRERINHRCEPPIKDRILGQAVWVAVDKYVNKGLSPQKAISHGFNWGRKRSSKVTQRDIGKYFNQTTNKPTHEVVAKTKPVKQSKPRKVEQPAPAPQEEPDLVSSEEASNCFSSVMRNLED